MGTILFFQLSGIDWPVLWIMSLAIFSGLLASIIPETSLLACQMAFAIALKTALGMSLLSIFSIKAGMNVTDYMLTGGAMLTWWAVPIRLVAGFLTLLPCNYWCLKALGKACNQPADGWNKM